MRFKDMKVGQVFTFPSSNIMKFVKVGPLMYGSLEKNSIRPIKLHGHWVFETYKMSIARACQNDLIAHYDAEMYWKKLIVGKQNEISNAPATYRLAYLAQQLR